MSRVFQNSIQNHQIFGLSLYENCVKELLIWSQWRSRFQSECFQLENFSFETYFLISKTHLVKV